MSERELIERAAETEGLVPKEWDEEAEDGLTARFGRFVVVTDDYEDEGFYANDHGTLDACVVGAAQYGNQRVAWTFTPDGFDSGLEVPNLMALDREEV